MHIIEGALHAAAGVKGPFFVLEIRKEEGFLKVLLAMKWGVVI